MSTSKYAGYCYLNNGAICVKSLIADKYLSYKKVAILDLDYHAGDGTSEIFSMDDSVLTISIHINLLYDYPYYSSFNDDLDDNGLDNLPGTNFNFIFTPLKI